MFFSRSLLILCLLITNALLQAQSTDYLAEIRAYRAEQNADFLDPEKSPLPLDERQNFKGHDFYEVDEDYKVKARFEATPDARPFSLPTSTGRTRLYRRIGILHFELAGKELTLEAYLQVQSFAMRTATAYVFLPVIDLTTGEATYGAGRYLHFEGIPEGEEWTIDFNKLYNPYCAYSPKYECPVVPRPNHLPIAIEAGVKDYSPNKK